MSSNKSMGVNPFFLKKQLETAAKESVATSGSKVVSTSLFSDELISSKAIARTQDFSKKPVQKSIPKVSTIVTTPTPVLEKWLRINGSILDLNGLGPYTVELNWATNTADITLQDIHSMDIPINPAIYDTPVGDSLPFHHNNNIFLAKTNCTTNCRKFLWICTTTKDMFWLIGYVPKKLSTWRESMLRHCMYVLTKPNNILSTDENGTVLLRITKQIGSWTPTMEDIRDQNTRMGGLKHDRKCVLTVDEQSKTPQLRGLKWIPGNLKMLQSGQKVYEPQKQCVKMGEGCLGNAPSTPLSVSVSQVCQAIQSLDGAVQPAPHVGPVKMKEAMMDIDNALFAMTANTIKMSAASSAESVIKLLKNTLSFVEQSSITNFIPSGEWQLKHNSGPTIRPINGGHWWLLPSPQVSKEPLKCWIHSKEFFDIKKLKLEAIVIAGALFDEIDHNNPERSTKLYEKNSSDAVKVPGGFMFPLCLGVMASRQGTHVTIFLETFSNKSHGIKLDALDGYDPFGTQHWVSQVTTFFLAKWNDSVLHMFTHLTDKTLGCFQPKHELTSVGFGFSTSYCDSNNVPLFSVCKKEEWMTCDGYESFCAMALHSNTCNHTTHFKSEPMLRVQAYIEAINCISDRQCGVKHSRYAKIGLSAAEKISSGEINVSAMLQGFNDDFNRINQAFKTMQRQPRNRTEIQVRCVVDETGKLQLRSMIQVAANIILESTLHYQLNHILSYSSLNVAGMFLISQQSWRLACDVHVSLKQRQLLLDIANDVLKRWKSFKSGRGDGTTGSKSKRTLTCFPELCEPLISKLNSMLPNGKRFRGKDDPIQIFTDHDIICDESFGVIMNKRIEKNKIQSDHLSRFIMKCCTCNKLFYGVSNRESLDCHLLDNPSCVTSKWRETQLVSAADWELDYSRKLCEYEEFLKTCSIEQKAACESVLTFGTGVFAVGIAGAGKSVALNMIGTILECIFYEPGEVFRCASTGLLAQYFHPSATTIHSAIGAYPSFGQSNPNWNLSVSQWRELIEQHCKVDHKLKVFINTEVYAQSSNMLKAFFEIRKEKYLKFVAIIDGDPPQPMHEDEIAESQANLELCSISDHFLLNRAEIRNLLPDVRILYFETPMRQKDPHVHELSTAIRYAKTEKSHIDMMRANEYDPKKHKVDIILCALRKDATKINNDELRTLPGSEHQYLPTLSAGAVSYSGKKLTPMSLKIGAPVLFTKNHIFETIDVKKTRRKIVNGTRGYIERCDTSSIVVALLNSRVKVRVEAIQSRDGKNICQLPIQLGWATTIKKAAGMTFNTIAVDFGLDWSQSEANLIQCAKRKWRTSQVYGAITRPRKLAYFCHASKFKDTVMIALSNNQNFAALEFLKNLTECEEQYVRTHLELRRISIQDDDLSDIREKKRSCYTCKLLNVTTLSNGDSIIDRVWANQWPKTLARQQSGSFCTGVLMSNAKKILLKKSNDSLQQVNEIRVLQCLSGTVGVPELIGHSDNQLVLSYSGETPHVGLLQSHHFEQLRTIIDSIHAKGWTFKFVTRQNVWTFGERVALFNFENAVLVDESDRITIDDFAQAFVSDCRLYKNYEENSDEGCQDPSDESIIVDVEDIIEPASAPEPIPSPPPEAMAKAAADKGDNAAIKRQKGDLVSAHATAPAPVSAPARVILPTPFTKLFIPTTSSSAIAPATLKTISNAATTSSQKSINKVSLNSTTTFGMLMKNPAPAPAPESMIVEGAADESMIGGKEIALNKTNPKPSSSFTRPLFFVEICPQQVPEFVPQPNFDKALQKWNRKTNEDRLIRVSKLWKLAHDEVYPTLGPTTSWESGLKGHRPKSLGYGEATTSVCELLCQVHEDFSRPGSKCLPRHSFVDIGSGICNIVLQMSALKPNFQYSFGIELHKPRARFAEAVCNVFTTSAAKVGIPFCQIQAQEGDCFKNPICENALKTAGLVWINNTVFQEEDNLKLYMFLYNLVPIGCIIVSFEKILFNKRGHDTTSKELSDFSIHPPRKILNSNSWEDPRKPKDVYIIQRTTQCYKFMQ